MKTAKWRDLYGTIPPDRRARIEAEVAQDLAEMAPVEEWRDSEPGGAAFLNRVEALKQRYGGGVSDFEPPRLGLVPPISFRRTD